MTNSSSETAGLVPATRRPNANPTADHEAIENERDGRLAGNLPKHRLGVGWHEASVLDDPGDPEDHEHTTLSVLGTRLPDGTLLAVGASQEHAEDLQEIIVEVAGLGLGLAALLAITGGLLMSRTALKRVSSINLSTDRRAYCVQLSSTNGQSIRPAQPEPAL